MKFSPTLMQLLPVEPFTVSSIAQPEKRLETRLYHWRGGYSAFAQFFAEALVDQSPGGDALRKYARQWFGSTWSGNPESVEGFTRTRLFPLAVSAFDKASAKLDAALTPRQIAPMVAGGAWIVPLVLGSHPLPSRIRQRTKLPPQNLLVIVSLPGYVTWQSITESTARIARAAWEYIQAGGAVRLVYRSVSGFASAAPVTGAAGLALSVEVPLTNKSELASACSAQLDRGPGSALAQALSPIAGDRLKPWLTQGERSISLTGDRAEDAKALEAFRIKG